MSISAVLNNLLIVIGLHVFLKNYFRDPWAPLIGYIAIFMCWGLSSSWSNLYHLRSFFYVGGFPSTAELNDWMTAHVLLLASIGDYRMYRLLASATDAVPPPPPVQLDERETVDVIVMPDRITQPVSPVPVSTPVDTPRLVAPAPSPKTENKISTPPRSSRRTPAKRDDLSASTYGAPIAEPLIAPTEEMLQYTTRPDTGVGSEEDTISVSVVTVPTDSMPSDSRPSAKETDTGAEVYGVPIPEPVLDPERHGG